MIRSIVTFALAGVLVACTSVPAEAAKSSRKKAPAKTAQKPAAAPVQSAYIRDPYVGAASAALPSGRVIFSDGGDRPARPASVTKLMTAYLVLEDVKEGRYKLTDLVTATADVNKSEPSWVGLKADDKMSVGDMLTALMVHSANDVAIALAVHSEQSRLGASEAQRKEQTGSLLMGFVARMNGEAAKLGMTGTKYHNPNGLPPKPKYPWKEHNVSTANDQLKLALALMKNHPEILQFTSVKTCDLFQADGRYTIAVTRRVGAPDTPTPEDRKKQVLRTYCNHNNVMVKDKLKIFDASGKEVVDGLKTGYIDAGGSSVVLTGQKDGKRVVVVVLGSKGSKLRDDKAKNLFNDAIGSVAW